MTSLAALSTFTTTMPGAARAASRADEASRCSPKRELRAVNSVFPSLASAFRVQNADGTKSRFSRKRLHTIPRVGVWTRPSDRVRFPPEARVSARVALIPTSQSASLRARPAS